MARIYVSSTFADLADYRKEVNLALRRLGHEDVAMEYYVAEGQRPLERCLADVSSSDVYIGVFAFRYGSGITEQEYRRALADAKPCLIFVALEDNWPMGKVELDALPRIRALRAELTERHVVETFQDANELARKVAEAVTRWEKRTGVVVRREPTDWDAYRQAVSNRHQWVRLQVIAGAGKDRGLLRVPLLDVFEPQLITPGASGADIPDAVRQYQEEIYGSREVPPDGTPDDEERLLAVNPEYVLDVLGRERTQVILGGPGTGKSTILQYAMLRVCAAERGADPLPHLTGAPIPFLVELRNYVLARDTDFISHIIRRSQELYGSTIEIDSLNRILEEPGGALVFFDGLDEVFDPDDRRRVIDQFQSFARRYSGARIVVTSRIAGYDRTSLGLAGFEHYTLMPLTLGHIRNFADHWYRYYTLEGTERTAQGLVQRIVESPRLLDLAGNPLLLTMMAVIYKDRDLPTERWRLYERCAETLLEDWDLGKGIKDEDFKLSVTIRTAQKSEILQQVAMYMLDHSEPGAELNAIAYAPLRDIIASYLQEKYHRSPGDAEAAAVDILRHLMERTYVLASIGERIFGFVHRTFMEYFAACRCQANFNARKSDFTWLTRDIFAAHWHKPEWEEVLLLLIAMLHDQGTPIRDIVDHLVHRCQMDVPFNLAFAARCLGEAGGVQDQTHGQTVLTELAKAIVEHARKSRRDVSRRFVDVALGSFAALAAAVAAPAGIHDLIGFLDGHASISARKAAWQMGFALRSRKERLDYALAALRDPEEVVRRGAIAALEGEFPGRADIGPALAGVVRRDRNIRVRIAALTTMQRSWAREPSILDAIASRAEEETAYTFVQRLITYLSTAWPGNDRALELVTRLAAPRTRWRTGYDEDSVRLTAAGALARGWAGKDQALAVLRKWAEDDYWSVVVPTEIFDAIARGWAGNADALASLQEMAVGGPRQVRPAVMQAIARGWAGHEQAFALLRNRAMDDPDVATREAAVTAIARGWTDSPQALAFLENRIIHAQDPETRAAAFTARMYPLVQRHGRSIGREEMAKTAELLQEYSGSPDPMIREIVIECLAPALSVFPPGYRWPGDLLTPLKILEDRAMNDPDVSIRVRALDVIARCLCYEQGEARREPLSERARGFIRDQLGLLREYAADSEDSAVRSQALWAIADGSPDDAGRVFLLDRAATDPAVETRIDGLRAIAWAWGDEVQVLDYLSGRGREDPDVEVRVSVREILDNLLRGSRSRYSDNNVLVTVYRRPL